MKKIFLYTMLTFILLIFSGCGENNSIENGTAGNDNTETAEQNNEAPEPAEDVDLIQFDNDILSKEPIVTLKTTKGNIVIKLFPEQAPKAVENFVTHSKNGYYNGLTFHRVISDFMIQGGDPEGNGKGGESIWGEPFEDEFSSQLFNFRGALSMANAGPNTNGSQFFIVQADLIDEELVDQMVQARFPNNVIEKYKEVGGTPWLDGAHTVFGQVVEGMEVVDAISSVEVDSKTSAPLEPVIINEVVVQE
ncbi:peptidylprolyl isomerase [Calidifontibacillus oryziterrae]|uniref:peptidylprolyl isomerase n=1 Tax=Calidifontibacillus oryziterrae TaxID=1191699 RepID=UPI000371235C